jgi:hypothetical protein
MLCVSTAGFISLLCVSIAQKVQMFRGNIQIA